MVMTVVTHSFFTLPMCNVRSFVPKKCITLEEIVVLSSTGR